jgi:hypothetical protein
MPMTVKERPAISPDQSDSSYSSVLESVLEGAILDAGCGRDLRLQLPGSAHVVGLDTFREALERRASTS